MAICFKSTKKEDRDRKMMEQMLPWLLWRIWKARNDLVFSNLDSDPQELLKKSEDDATEWHEANKKEEISCPTIHSSSRSQRWISPPPGKYKCNIDAIWSKDDQTCGAGWILRDNAGNVCWIGAKSYPKLHFLLQAEAAALSWTLSCLNSLQLDEVMIESDCQTLVKALEHPKDWFCLGQTTAEPLRHKERRGHSFGFAKREQIHVQIPLPKSLSYVPCTLQF